MSSKLLLNQFVCNTEVLITILCQSEEKSVVDATITVYAINSAHNNNDSLNGQKTLLI